MLSKLIAVAVGGACGALARYGLTEVSRRLFPDSLFPWGTAAVNILGCLILGAFVALIRARSNAVSAEAQLLIATGFLGSLTTFSTFSVETLGLMQKGELRLAGLYLAANLILGFAAAEGGAALMTRVILKP